MIIEKISTRGSFNWAGLVKTVGLTLFVLTLTVPAFLIILGSVGNPTGSPVSPLPEGEVATAPTPTPVLSAVASLNLAQNFLDKAYALAKIENQTPEDKKQIIANLNQSLTYATGAINQSANDPKGYLMRAQILIAISKIKPEALREAQSDLDLAERLSHGQNLQLPNPVNPINLIPEEQASLAQNIIIAAPGESSPSAVTTDEGSNGTRGSAILTAGLTEVTVIHPAIKENSYIYLIPSRRDAVISVKSKAAGTFIIQSTAPLASDLPLDYWVINQ